MVFTNGSNRPCFDQGDQDSAINQTDAKGLKQGFWKAKFDNGRIKYEGYFKDNHPVGELKRYYEEGD